MYKEHLPMVQNNLKAAKFVLGAPTICLSALKNCYSLTCNALMPLRKIVVLTRNLILDPAPIPQNPGGALKWQEGVSGSSMDTQKAP